MTDSVMVDKLKGIHYLSYLIARSFLIAVLCFVCFLTMLFMCYFVSVSINSKSPLFGAYVIVSPSMVPTIKINDAIIIKREANDMYNVGDIITFSSTDANYKGLAITHRVVDKKVVKDGKVSKYITKGDNNIVEDTAPVMTDDIYGKVLFKIPKVGYIQSFFSKPTNFFLCLLIPGMIFAFYEVCRIMMMLLKEKKV